MRSGTYGDPLASTRSRRRRATSSWCLGSPRMPEARSDRYRRAVRWVTVAVLTVVFVMPFLGNRVRVADVDPQFMRDLIERSEEHTSELQSQSNLVCRL